MARTTIRTEDITASEVTTAKMATDPTNADNLASGSVPAARLGNVDTSGITANADDIALLGFKVAANGSLAKYNLVDQTVDDFQDTSGVDASASTGELRQVDGANKFYSGAAIGTATGGDTVTTSGIYKIHTFTTVGTSAFVVGGTGSGDVEYLVVAGGGGGGGRTAGGGGAGGFRTNVSGATSGGGGSAEATMTLGAGSHSVIVGAGGLGSLTNNHSSNQGLSGDDSSFAGTTTITSTGGGGGQGTVSSALSGGSGGGGLYPDTFGTGTANQGYAGGDGVGASNGSGGGGGAGSVGEDGASNDGGNGGSGVSSSISGSAVTYAGGGGGGTWTSGSSGNGGSGGGGNAAPANSGAKGSAGTANTGGGGGGGCTDASPNAGGGNGGSGIVIIRYVEATGFTSYNDMTLVSTATTAESAPTKGDIVFTYTNAVGTATLGTDLTVEYSADDGSNWTNFSIGPSDSQGTTGGHTIVAKHNVSLTSASGTAMRWRIKTLNQSASKATNIQAVSLGWS